MAQGVKDPTSSLQPLEVMLWHRFDPSPGTSACHRLGPKKKKAQQ